MVEGTTQHMHFWQYTNFSWWKRSLFLMVPLLLVISNIVTKCLKWQSHLCQRSEYTVLLVLVQWCWTLVTHHAKKILTSPNRGNRIARILQVWCSHTLQQPSFFFFFGQRGSWVIPPAENTGIVQPNYLCESNSEATCPDSWWIWCQSKQNNYTNKHKHCKFDCQKYYGKVEFTNF